MVLKEVKEKATPLEIAKIIAPWFSLPIGTLILALVPQVRDHIWPGTPKWLLLVLLVISLSAILGLVPYALRLRRKLQVVQGELETLKAKSTYKLDEGLTHKASPLDEPKNQILVLVAKHNGISSEQLNETLAMELVRLEYHLHELCSKGYIKNTRAGMRRANYLLMPKGRKYLVESELV